MYCWLGFERFRFFATARLRAAAASCPRSACRAEMSLEYWPDWDADSKALSMRSRDGPAAARKAEERPKGLLPAARAINVPSALRRIRRRSTEASPLDRTTNPSLRSTTANFAPRITSRTGFGILRQEGSRGTLDSFSPLARGFAPLGSTLGATRLVGAPVRVCTVRV